ncbi:glutathione S-transferase 1-1-like [Augochlora pura]
MPIDFYYFPPSPPCRSVMLLAKTIGVHLNLKTVNVIKGETRRPSYVKMNPQHSIPTIDDNGFILCESRPIMGYLVSKYAKNDSLYPRDSKRRAKVDQMLYFDHGILFANVLKYYIPVVFGLTNVVNEDGVKATERACELLNTFLEDSEFVAGDTLTIADFAISTSICVLQCFNFDIGRYDNVAAWYSRCKEQLDKFDEVHAEGVQMFTELYQQNIS